MKSTLTLVVLAALTLGMTGCIAQKQHDDLRTLHRKAQERIVELEGLLADKEAEIAALRGASSGADANLAARLAEAEAEAQRLREELRALAAGPGDLTPELVSALQRLADQYPGLMTFDPDRKAIQLQSDLTFDLGSTKVKAGAAESLAKLASVLNTADAAPFEVKVVGHTDNVPVTNPANKQKFEDNWGLSAFRAKSVMEVLRRNGVGERRMSIVGYGEH
ncbi:MAG: OmpA family protein, partial [Planctomycetes bacterium]|nr:OmpA family protein [Planctomycetota bacterium]